MKFLRALVSILLCAASAGAVTPIKDWGYEEGRAKVDFNGDGNLDLCRVIGSGYPNSYVICSLSSGPALEQMYAGADVQSASIDWGYPAGRAWIDFNGDKRADYCRIVGGSENGFKAKCLLSTGTAFGSEIMSDAIDPGFEDTRLWKDVNNDGKVDFCRKVGNNREFIRCTMSAGTAFGQEITDTVH
jgi:hypothetical protein